jgi:heme/copper-type cytochrome/quinol oxidase subunit 4
MLLFVVVVVVSLCVLPKKKKLPTAHTRSKKTTRRIFLFLAIEKLKRIDRYTHNNKRNDDECFRFDRLFSFIVVVVVVVVFVWHTSGSFRVGVRVHRGLVRSRRRLFGHQVRGVGQ